MNKGARHISLPYFGSYTSIIGEVAKEVGWELIMPAPPSRRTVELGVKYMNELMCYPAKVTLGSLIEAAERGATDVFTFASCGSCRQKAYWVLQDQVLKQLGYKTTVHPITLGIHTISEICTLDPSLSHWKSTRIFVNTLRKVKKFDDLNWFNIEVTDYSSKPKIGVVGEIYTILEPAVNMNLFEKLHKMDVLVHNSLPLSYFIFKIFYETGFIKRKDIDTKVLKEAEKYAEKYLPIKSVGGHGKEAVIYTIYYALKGFDGVIHLLPFPCMPESTVASVLDRISEDYNLPVLRLVFDEHSGEAGVDTRLEAFVDILKRKKRGSEERILRS